jgi:hypothetical protein
MMMYAIGFLMMLFYYASVMFVSHKNRIQLVPVYYWIGTAAIALGTMMFVNHYCEENLFTLFITVAMWVGLAYDAWHVLGRIFGFKT